VSLSTIAVLIAAIAGTSPGRGWRAASNNLFVPRELVGSEIDAPPFPQRLPLARATPAVFGAKPPALFGNPGFARRPLRK
jgi:hypothetical protein